MSIEELRRLVMVNTYKLALTRNQMDVMIEILHKKKIASPEEIWKKTNARFNKEQNSKE